ncbi:hypothetical protein [Paenibacillus campi]|uniref:hypothetical protein n=1 Tax=Paenibacillus campi TaxID=3106031 RepID=UPI002AFF48F7|nr:hypothetical protein [Paenibacillus sp. SGZ-1009]
MAVGMVAIVLVAVWISLILFAQPRKLINHHTPRPDETATSGQTGATSHNVVDLADFRQRRVTPGKEMKRTQQLPEQLLKGDQLQEHKKAVPATVRPLPLSKSGDVPKLRLQKCSYCKKEVHRLTFYATDKGGLVGVCKDCEPIAKRQDLLPL